MVQIMTREQTNLPPVPSSLTRVPLSYWKGVRVHHSGSSFSSWRDIHDWQTEGRPEDEQLAYIGYSFGISEGKIWTLRGWDIKPAHDFINTHLGIVFGGNFENTLPSNENLTAFVEFLDIVSPKISGTLSISTHREVQQTACPGLRLHNWVKETLPSFRGDDMSWQEELINDTYPKSPGSGTRMMAYRRLIWTQGQVAETLDKAIDLISQVDEVIVKLDSILEKLDSIPATGGITRAEAISLLESTQHTVPQEES